MAKHKKYPSGTKDEKRDPNAAPERIAFSDRLKELKDKNELTYSEMSDKINNIVTDSALQNYVARTSEPGNLLTIITIAQAFHITTDYLLGLTEKVEDPQARGIPEYLNLSPKAVQSLHDSTAWLAELGRQKTGAPSLSGISVLSGILEDYSPDLLIALGRVLDSTTAAQKFCGQLAASGVKPSEMDITTSIAVQTKLEEHQRNIGYAENVLMRLVQKAMDEILGVGKMEDDLFTLHEQLVQTQYDPNSMFQQQMKAIAQNQQLQAENEPAKNP